MSSQLRRLRTATACRLIRLTGANGTLRYVTDMATVGIFFFI